MNGVQTRFKCKLDVKRCKRFVFPPSSLLPRSNALKTKAIRYFQTDRTLTRIVSPPLFEEQGVQGWVGYTYTWLANMQARLFNGDAASRSLHIFIKAFCSPNSFHLNGDQLRKGYSGFTYRPFTLEGNFAYASAIQEMLLQSHTGVIRVFPALPESWQEASFQNMRAIGGFLVSADYQEGKVKRISIHSEKGGWMKVFNPFTQKIVICQMKTGETFNLSSTD